MLYRCERQLVPSLSVLVSVFFPCIEVSYFGFDGYGICLMGGRRTGASASLYSSHLQSSSSRDAQVLSSGQAIPSPRTNPRQLLLH